MKRRALLNSAIAAGAVSAVASKTGRARGEASRQPRIIDSNVSLFRWPFRRLPLDRTERLAEKMENLGIGSALAGSFDGIFHRDITSANRRLAEACEPLPQLVPVGSINPALPGWAEDLQRCREEFGMPGIRLHPNYHGYALDDARFSSLLEFAAESNLFVQIAAALEDTRTQPAKLVVPDVDLAPLPDQLAAHPGVRVQILNWKPRGAVLETLAGTPGLCFDTARVDGTTGIANLLKATSPERVLFGSHAPFLIPEAALIRMHESNLSDAQLPAVLHANASRFRSG